MKYDKDKKAYIHIAKDDNRDRVEIEIGDIKDPKVFHPQMKIKRWDNEVNFSYRLIDKDKENPEITYEEDKIKWKGEKKDIQFYKTTTNDFDELRDLDLGNYISKDIGKVELFKEPYDVIKMNGMYWGSDSPEEREVRKKAAEKAFGNVLIVGLGLGVINEYLKINPNITSITTIEFSQDVIDIVKENFPDRLVDIRLITGEYFEYAKKTKEKFDYIYGDIFSKAGVPYHKKWERFIDSAKNLLTSFGEIDGRAKEVYENTKREMFDDPAYEFEITLKDKPSTNELEFSLQTKDIDFFYQPSLTEEIIPEKGEIVTDTYHLSSGGELKVFRPARVVGSYALYHKNPPKNIKDNKKYETGKLGHIYRPKIYDADGKWVWGKLNVNIEKEILTVIIPQDFLDTARYPITHAAGSTFGYFSKGASQADFANTIRGSKFTGAEGIGNSVTAYLTANAANAYTVKANLYVHSTLVPLSRGTTDEKKSLGSGTLSALVTFNFSQQPTLTAIDYVVAVWGQGAYKSTLNIHYDAGAVNQGQSQSLTYVGAWPNPLVPTLNTNKYSLYVTYNEKNISFRTNPLRPAIYKPGIAR